MAGPSADSSTLNDDEKRALYAVLHSDHREKGADLEKRGIRWSSVFTVAETENALKFSNANIQSIVKFVAEAGALETFLSHKWQSVDLQCDLLSALMTVPFSEFRSLPLTLDESNFPPHLKPVAHKLAKEHFNVTLLVHLALETVIRDQTNVKAAQFIDVHAKLVPELFFIGGLSIEKPWPIVLERILTNFFDLFLVSGHSSSALTFYFLAQHDKMLLVRLLIDAYEKDLATIVNILAVANETNLLDELLFVKHFSFTFDLAVVAERNGLYLFENYVSHCYKLYNNDFVSAMCDLLEVKTNVEYVHALSRPGLKSVSVAINFLSSVEIPPERLERFRAVQLQCLQSYPRLINFGQGHDAAILAITNANSNSYAPEVEGEMKLYYQKMYEQQIEIRDIISMLQKLKKSDEPRDQDVFCCMVHSLFDEYRFFPEYPLSALANTAVLFGGLVYFRLIDGIPLTIAMRIILDSLRQPTDTNMFKFGLQALFEFRQRLTEFPRYCSVLLDIPGLASQRQFFEQIKEIVTSNKSATPGGTAVDDPDAVKGLSDQMVIDMSSQEDPNDVTSDKILFIINNLSMANVVSKSQELAGLLESRYYGWFARYIVNQRSNQEPNFHSLYIAMLQNIGSKSLDKFVVKTSYTSIIQLFNHPDIVESSDKKTQLKNLGQWIGALLLANNKPILHNNIDFKLLIVDGYTSGKVSVVVPFACKVLEKATASLVFKPPNPWLMGIMKVLSELYQFVDLKLNLKFEIEVLCNALQLNIEDVEPDVIIRNPDLLTAQEAAQADRYQQQRVASSVLPGLGTPQHMAASVIPQPAVDYATEISSLMLRGQSVFVTHPTMKKIFYLAVDKSIGEVLQPTVERTLSIASVTTRELVTKDFALEPDEMKLRIAAQKMCCMLTTNIALATCKDPLKDALATHLRALMISNGYSESNQLAEQIFIALNDNIDLICGIVEKIAVEKCILEVDEQLVPSIMLRKRHRESGNGQPFMDSHLKHLYALQLPDPFRLTVGGLSAQQLSIYDNFGQVEESTGVNPMAHPPPSQQQRADGTPVLQTAQIQAPQSLAEIKPILDQLQAALEETGSSVRSVAELGPSSPVRQILNHFVSYLATIPETVMLKISQLTIPLLFNSTYNTDLIYEVYSLLLEKMCSLSTATAKEITAWLIYSDDERRFNLPVILQMFRAGIITPSEFDFTMSKHILAGSTNHRFAVDLIKNCIIVSNPPLALRTDFLISLEALESLDKKDSMVTGLITELNSHSVGDSDLQTQLGVLFYEWVRLLQHPMKADRFMHAFVYQLGQAKVLDKHLPLFIRTAIEISLDSATSDQSSFYAIDSLAKLVGTALDACDNKKEILNVVLSVVILILAKEHDSAQFGSLVFFRFFSSFFYEVNDAETCGALAIALRTLQPLAFPGFAFAWMSLISHARFLPLLMESKENWPLMATLVEALIKFQRTYLIEKNFPETLSAMYKGTLRIVLMMVMDFPEFIIEYHHKFCNVMPLCYVQLRNLILSAFPKEMTLPDPFTQGLKVDRLPEIKLSPPVGIDPANDLIRLGIKKYIDSYLKSPSPSTISQIVQAIRLPKGRHEAGVGFTSLTTNDVAVNALVLYIGINATASQTTGDEGEPTFDQESNYLKLIVQLMLEMNTEARYLLSEAMANQLRYPNRHTHFFSCVVLSLFGIHGANALKDKQLEIQHIITRVLLERIICNRPHPWGLMITFTELLKNPSYDFWDLPFTKTNPEIERIFASLYEHMNARP